MAFPSLRLTLARGRPWSISERVRPSRANAIAPLVLKSSQFAHLFEEGPTEAIYRGTPLYGLGHYQQGQLAQEWARSMLREQNPESEMLDPDPGRRCNGQSRCLHTAPCDFLMGGKRVEVKSSRMAWNSSKQCWVICFWSIKKFEFDDLYLVVLSPDGLHLIQHDLHTGFGRDGQRTEISGHVIKVHGSKRRACWREAVETMLAKLCEKGSCTQLVRESFAEASLDSKVLSRVGSSNTLAQDLYSGVPMSKLMSNKRGLRLQAMGLAVDSILHPKSHFSTVLSNSTEARLRGTSNAFADWSRDRIRVELKSSSLAWAKHNATWRCRFCNIKPDFFDELWLSIYSPLGIHFYRSHCLQHLVFSRNGMLSEHNGLYLRFSGPANEADPIIAWQVIGAKIIARGYELVAIAYWAP